MIKTLFMSVGLMAASLTEYVDPWIGTGGHGHVFIGANVPFGMVQVGPTTALSGWDHCSGYHYDDRSIIGFSHLHLSGTGVGDLGDVALLPVSSPEQTSVAFSHSGEIARPGYYAVRLEDPGLLVELTATERAAMHRYSVSGNDPVWLRLDLEQGIGDREKGSVSNMLQTGPSVVEGYRISNGWADLHQVYFVMEFSRPVRFMKYENKVSILEAQGGPDPLLVKVGISAVSTGNARLNLEQEMPGWDFDAVASRADALWENELGKIRIESEDVSLLRSFYTALYHTMIAPSLFSDVNGEYRGSDKEVHHSDGPRYTTLSLWDTYRALHPLMTLIHPDRMEDLCRTMLAIYEEQGKLPVWPLMGCETNCMPGNSAMPVLGDMLVKGLVRDIPLREEVFRAMKESSHIEARSLGNLRRDGYLAADKNAQSVARALEYCVDDDAVYQVASLLGHREEAAYYYRFSRSYARYFDSSSGFMRGIDTKGRFRTPFTSVRPMTDYVEGNAWQYTFMVPHDVHGLVGLFGAERFVQKLDSLFITVGDLGEDAAPDISGLIGQYAHGNEPSHHVIYMYDYVGMPFKAAPLLRHVMTDLYHDTPDGLCGNEDVGQMSAWYILSALGIYQVAPTGGRFVFGSPMVDRAKISIGGHVLEIVVHGQGKDRPYIRRAVFNGSPLTRSYLDYAELAAGGTLEFWMGSKPSAFGTAQSDRP